jgi:TetR/AcrR family transcriptional regulator, transcriptional repressor of bet genes
MARPSNTQERRKQIVQAFVEVMATQGYAKATIQQIANTAGLAPGLIHYHFKNKQEILLELVQQISDLILNRYQQKSEKATSAKEKIKAYIDAHLAKDESSTSGLVAAWVVIGTEAIRQEEVQMIYESVLKKQQAILEKLLIEAGEKQKTSIKQKVAMIMAAIEGSFQLSITAKNIMPQNYAAKTLYEMVEKILD